MTMQHTPGPWIAPHFSRDDVGCDCRHVLAEPYFGGICEVGVDNGKAIGDGGNDCPPLEEAKANARLIAAAPDLLAAMQNSIALADRNRDAMELLGHKVERPPEMQAVYDACVAAVNKATGAA